MSDKDNFKTNKVTEKTSTNNLTNSKKVEFTKDTKLEVKKEIKNSSATTTNLISVSSKSDTKKGMSNKDLVKINVLTNKK